MDLRLALYDLADRYRLDTAARRRLPALAGLTDAPAALERRLVQGLAVLAAALGGFGILLWIAANWSELGRAGRFALLMGTIALLGAAAAARPRARTPLALLTLVLIGVLLAFFGQTYQTGADPWHLFALWAALALPLALGARSDVLWTPWVLVAMVAIALWTQAQVGMRWSVQPQDLSTHVLAWTLAAALVALPSTLWHRWTGAGAWSFRSAVLLAAVLVGSSALGALFAPEVAPQYGLGLLVLALAAALLSTRRGFDVFALSAVALVLDTLLVAWLAHMLFLDNDGDTLAPLLAIGVSAAALLAGSVSLILHLHRRHAEPGQPPPSAGASASASPSVSSNTAGTGSDHD